MPDPRAGCMTKSLMKKLTLSQLSNLLFRACDDLWERKEWLRMNGAGFPAGSTASRRRDQAWVAGPRGRGPSGRADGVPPSR